MKVAVINSSYYGMKPGDKIYNLAVDRIANYHRYRGDEVYAGPWDSMFLQEYHKFYFSVIFTWDIPAMIEQVNKVLSWSKLVEIGGPAATFMHTYIYAQTGIQPHIGLDDRFEHVPWPEGLPGGYKLTFTSRGCPHKCLFCGVKQVEPHAIEYPYFPLAPMVGDNNILSTTWGHQELVVNRLSTLPGKIDINSGFDVRFFEPKHKELYSRLRLEYWRFAFDTLDVWQDVWRVAQMMRNNGLDRHQVMFYCLIGFPGTAPWENLLRLNMVIDLGMMPYPMRFIPLNSLTHRYVAPGWTEEFLFKVQTYYQTPFTWMSATWEEFDPGKNIIEIPAEQGVLIK